MQERIVDVEELRRYYEVEGMSTKQVGDIYGVTNKTIRAWLHKYGIPVRSMATENRKYQVNDQYFKNIDTLNKAYILGFICADGYVGNNRRGNPATLGVALSNGDRDVLQFIKHELGSEHPIKLDKTGQYCSIPINSVELCNSLVALGIVPNKTLSLDIAEVIERAGLNEEQIPAFLLGYYDGDGCISNWVHPNGTTIQTLISVVGTVETCQYIQQYFGKGFLKKRHNTDTNNITLQISGRLAATSCLDRLYKNPPSFFLKRKYDKYLLAKVPSSRQR